MSDLDRIGGDHQLVFVAGLHRSGTTVLVRLLGAHPDVSGFSATDVKEDEGQHLQSVYPSARSYGGAGRFAFDERAHLTESSSLATSGNAERLFDEWRPHWDLSKRVLVEKSPPNLVMTRFLKALYPSARFLVLMRHPIIVSLSTSKWKGGDRTLLPLVDHWLTAHEIFRADAREVQFVHALHYEDLMSDPKGTLSAVESFLALETPVDYAPIDPARSDVYADKWTAMLTSPRRRDRLLVTKIRERYAERIASFGYDIECVERVMSR